MLVYLLAPSASSLQTNSNKVCLDWVGPLVVANVLDQSHMVLEDLTSRTLQGVYHVNRLKFAYVRTENASMLVPLTN